VDRVVPLAREPPERLDVVLRLRVVLARLRVVLAGLRVVVRRRPPLRSRAGISACATAFVSRGISFSRKPAIRFSSRRIAFASLAVSRSPTFWARFAIIV
jgi:hypothetical protein